MTQITGVVERLVRATNAHDLDALGGCFAADFVNETPLHPARNFKGRDQVRRNWSAIFAGAPDIRAKVLRSVADADTAWVEWEMSGNRAHGTGRLGSLLVPLLRARGLEVRVLTRETAHATHLRAEGVTVVQGDVRDPASLGPATAGAATVVSAVHGFAGTGGVSPRNVDY